MARSAPSHRSSRLHQERPVDRHHLTGVLPFDTHEHPERLDDDTLSTRGMRDASHPRGHGRFDALASFRREDHAMCSTSHASQRQTQAMWLDCWLSTLLRCRGHGLRAPPRERPPSRQRRLVPATGADNGCTAAVRGPHPPFRGGRAWHAASATPRVLDAAQLRRPPTARHREAAPLNCHYGVPRDHQPLAQPREHDRLRHATRFPEGFAEAGG